MTERESKLFAAGISHKSASLAELELFRLSKKDISSAYNYLKSGRDINGAVVISTCNRVEFYLTANTDSDPISFIQNFYSEKGINLFNKRKLFYHYSSNRAAEHLFRVICGLDSMVLGEYQIQGQIKDSYSLACKEKAADKILHKLFHAAFRVGKSVRTQTRIGSGKQSVSGIAFQIIKDKLNGKDPVAIFGVNQNTNIIAEKLFSSGFSNLVFINRTLYKAEKLADRFAGSAYGLDKIEQALADVKCIFSCTGAPGYIITADQLSRIFHKSGSLKLIIDIAVPRDIETKGISREAEVYDLDGLKSYLKNQEKDIVVDLPVAEKIISEEAAIFGAWYQSQSDESIAYYDEKMESVRLQFLNEARENISAEEFQVLEKFSRSLTHRLKSAVYQSVRAYTDQKKAG